jgi:hypothetical protein
VPVKSIVPLLLLLPGLGRAEEKEAWPPDVADVVPAPSWQQPPRPPDACCTADGNPCDWCSSERFSLQFLTGAYVTAIGPRAAFDPYRPVGHEGYTPFDFANVDVRLGYRPFLPPPGEEYRFRDRFEMLLDFQGAAVYHGVGNYVFGPTLLLREDLADPDRTLVPYIQGGAGLAFTDGYKDPHQRALGQWQEFFLQGMAGLHWRMSDCWSLDVEGGWQHVSNACLATRNAGVNNLGGSIGLTYTFAARHP